MRSRHLPGIIEYEAAMGACGRGRRVMDATVIIDEHSDLTYVMEKK